MSRASLGTLLGWSSALTFWLVSCSLVLVGAQDAKGASVSLVAKWPGTSLLLETAEFLV